MRKDVRLGLAVGGVFFVVVLVYALFFTGGKHNGNEQTNRNANVPRGAAPNVGVQAPGEPRSPESSQGSGTVNISGPGGPADSNAKASASGGFNWSEALNNGAPLPLLAHSQTPEPSAPVSRDVAVAPAADYAEPTTRPSSASRSYTVKPGETFWTIAKAEYGNGSYFGHLVRANPKISPSKLRSGMTIVIPDKSEVVPASVAAREATVASATTRPADPATHYRVQAGDNLYNICKKLYGKTEKVDKLYEMNKGVIGPNPAVLKLNMILQLPEAPAASGNGLAGAVQ
jgi:phage tail protein X